ncbi:NUCB2.2 family protein [Megaselia abdita]
MRGIIFLMSVQFAWTMPFSNDERYIHDIVGLVKEDLRFYEQLENEPLLVNSSSSEDSIKNLLALYTVKSRLNEIQKKEMERIQQQQELDTELDIIIEHLDYTNEHNFKRSDIEKLHGKLIDDIKDNNDILEQVHDLHNSVSNQVQHKLKKDESKVTMEEIISTGQGLNHQSSYFDALRKTQEYDEDSSVSDLRRMERPPSVLIVKKTRQVPRGRLL